MGGGTWRPSRRYAILSENDRAVWYFRTFVRRYFPIHMYNVVRVRVRVHV